MDTKIMQFDTVWVNIPEIENSSIQAERAPI